jgi:hypothetical protein
VKEMSDALKPAFRHDKLRDSHSTPFQYRFHVVDKKVVFVRFLSAEEPLSVVCVVMHKQQSFGNRSYFKV